MLTVYTQSAHSSGTPPLSCTSSMSRSLTTQLKPCRVHFSFWLISLYVVSHWSSSLSSMSAYRYKIVPLRPFTPVWHPPYDPISVSSGTPVLLTYPTSLVTSVSYQSSIPLPPCSFSTRTCRCMSSNPTGYTLCPLSVSGGGAAWTLKSKAALLVALLVKRQGASLWDAALPQLGGLAQQGAAQAEAVRH